jgi:hypothetical protein
MLKLVFLLQVLISINSQETLTEIIDKYCIERETLVIPETQRSIFNSLRAQLAIIDTYDQYLVYFKDKTKI